MNWPKPKSPSTCLGLTLDGATLDAAVVHRSNGSIEVLKTTSAPLALDPLKNEPELLGREIRKQLDAAGIRERHVAVGIPLHWFFAVPTAIPPLDEADVQPLLDIEAERGFPRGLDELQIARSRIELRDGQKFVLQLGVPTDYVSRLETILAAAQLKPVSLSIGIATLPQTATAPGEGRLIAWISPHSVEIALATCGGLAVLRSLPAPIDQEGGTPRLLTEAIAREIRVTLGQLPQALRDTLKRFAILGHPKLAQELRDALLPRATALGITLDPPGEAPDTVQGLKIRNGMPATPPVCLAARHLANPAAPLEFLLPKATLFKRLTERYSTRRIGSTVTAAAAVLVLVLGAFLYQQFRLSSLRSEWNVMRSKVAEIEELRSSLRTFRPWNDPATPNLEILRALTEAFPEDGAVSAKSIEIRQGNAVSLSGTARDNSSLLRTIAKLRDHKQVLNVQVDQIRGKSPLQFTFNFAWTDSPTP